MLNSEFSLGRQLFIFANVGWTAPVQPSRKINELGQYFLTVEILENNSKEILLHMESVSSNNNTINNNSKSNNLTKTEHLKIVLPV